MSAPKPNAELAYLVLDHIDAHPEQWDQGRWISRPDGADCGTAGCFAGWACMLSGNQPDWTMSNGKWTNTVTADGYWKYVGDRAAELLGISEVDAEMLFDADNQRDDLDRHVAEIFGPRPGSAS